MKKILFIIFINTILSYSQEYFPTNTKVKSTSNDIVALTNAKIYINPSKIIKNGTLVIKNGKIEQVGASIKIPNGTKQIDLKGKSIYPSFIDVYSTFGIKSPQKQKHNFKPQYNASRTGYYWNDHIRPETKSFNSLEFDNEKAKKLLSLGFGVVNTHLEDGIMQGNGVLVALEPSLPDAYRILNNNSVSYLSFNKSKQSNQIYPTSLMGAIALLRQVYLDAEWYAKEKPRNTDLALEAINNNKTQSQIFNAGNYLNVLRADKLGDMAGVQYTILGGGNEYERIDQIKKTNATLILPINFRKAYDVSNPFHTKRISLHDMRSWNQEPTNPYILDKNGVEFALTTSSLKSLDNFQKNLLKAIKYGLDKETALRSLTTVPAKILKNDKIGNLKSGSYANFIITSGDIFNNKTILYENWVLGVKNVINSMDIKDLSGIYDITTNGNTYEVTISGIGKNQKAVVKLDDKKLDSNFSFKDNWLQLTINHNEKFIRLISNITEATIQGKAIDNNGKESFWKAIKKEKNNTKKGTKTNKTTEILAVSYPNIGYGNKELPKQENILIKNTTIWTSEEKNAVLENTDILLKKGKIAKIGKNINDESAKIIDGKGKYVTSGIIDEHSHIATTSVNESGHNSSAEVSIEDVLNPDDVNIYRNLAGGVTSIQILHGSANPIGGRSAIIKLKWGEYSDELIYKNSPKFIKFALGENVKQSNWGNFNNVRFPQTRMGVEQVYIDYFQRAIAYEKAKKTGLYRKDIELETLLEIINGKRFISCHSYVQSEINMLMKVAEKFGFKVNTFTHILEGYKVADKIKKHGAGGSTFADWWAYKYEVNDAIPYNAAIMHNQGITVAINSDDAEMSRRLNHEAAKLVKYGGMTEQDAWKTVTINPAKLLHLDDRTGSLTIGKDADVVIWSGNPLSVYSKVLTTIVDGTIYFSTQKNKQKQLEIKEERSKLINLMLKEKLKGESTQIPNKKTQKLFHCDSE